MDGMTLFMVLLGAACAAHLFGQVLDRLEGRR